MARAYQAITLAGLRQLALMYSHEVDGTNEHWTPILNTLINDGSKRMWDDYGGLRDTLIFPSVVGQQNYDLPQGVLFVEHVLFGHRPLRPTSFRDLGAGHHSNSTPDAYCLYMDTSIGQPQLVLWTLPGPPDTSKTFTIFVLRTPKDMIADTDPPEIPLQWQTAPAYYAALQMAIADKNPAAQGLASVLTKMQTDMTGWLRKNKDRFPVTGQHTR